MVSPSEEEKPERPTGDNYFKLPQVEISKSLRK